MVRVRWHTPNFGVCHAPREPEPLLLGWSGRGDAWRAWGEGIARGGLDVAHSPLGLGLDVDQDVLGLRLGCAGVRHLHLVLAQQFLDDRIVSAITVWGSLMNSTSQSWGLLSGSLP